MKLDKNELNGYWLKANKETLDALVEAGYECIADAKYTGAAKQQKYHVDNGGFVTCLRTNYKQAYYHNGEFYDTDPKAEEQQNIAHGLDEKVPFPELDEIKWVKVKTPIWFRASLCFEKTKHQPINMTHYITVKNIYENSKDFTVTWGLKDKHADIKAEYAAAKEAEKNGGPIVKVEWRELGGEWRPIDGEKCEWSKNIEHRLRYYNINWNKVPRFTEVEVSEPNTVGGKTHFLARLKGGKFAVCSPSTVGLWKHCRPAPGVEILDEWLEEVTDEA
jgi:hypothetical protein